MGDDYDYDRRYDRRRNRSRSEDYYYYDEREMSARRPRAKDTVLDRDDQYYVRQSSRRNRDVALVPDSDVDNAQREVSRALVRADDRSHDRRDMIIYDSDEYSTDDSRRRRRRHHSRHQSRHDSGDGRRDDRKSRKDKDKDRDREAQDGQGGRCWYSGKDRSEANFMEKNFDSSYDGIIAGIAGAALGAMTANRFGKGENKKAIVAGSALAGAASFNAAENWYRVFTEEDINIKEVAKKKVKKEVNKLRH